MCIGLNQAIDECIKDNVLANYIRKHRGEVEHMSIYEFNQELYDEDLRDEGRAEGRAEGYAGIITLIRKKLQKSLPVSEIADMLELDIEYVTTVVRLLEECPEESDREIAEKMLHM